MVLCALAALAPAALRIELKATKVAYHVGEWAELSAEARNDSKSPIAFVKADASLGGMHAPYCHMERRRDDGQWEVVSMALGVCGNTDFTIHREQFVVVAPGASKSFADHGLTLAVPLQELMNEPGEYTLRLVYDTRPEPERWMGVNGAAMMGGPAGRALTHPKPSDLPWFGGLYAKVPKGLFVSNEITIRVLPPKP